MTTILDLPQELLGAIFQQLEPGPTRRAFYAAHPCVQCSEAVNAEIQEAGLDVQSGGKTVKELLKWPKMAPNPQKLQLCAGKNFQLSPAWLKDPPDALISFLRKSQAYTRTAELLTGVLEVELTGWRLGRQDAITVSLMLASTCPRMNSLIMSSCQISMQPLRAHILGSRLTSLAISRCSTLDIRSTEHHLYGGDALIRGIAARLPCLQHLNLFLSDSRSLDLQNDDLPDLDVGPLSSLTSLHSLSVHAFDRYSALDRMRRPGVLYGLPQVLSSCTQLSHLTLGMASVQLLFGSLSMPPAGPPTNSSLLQLNLPAVDLQDLRELLHLAPNLHTLHLGRLEVPDEPPELCASWLHDALLHMQARELGPFQSCPHMHGPQPPSHYSRTPKSAPTPPHHLWLSYYPISGRLTHAAPLLSVLAPFKYSLHHLTLHRFVLLPQDVQALVSALPGLVYLSLVRCDLSGMQFSGLLGSALPQLRRLHLRLGVVDQADFVRGVMAADQARRAVALTASMANPLSSAHLRIEYSRHYNPGGLEVEECMKPGGSLKGLANVVLHDIDKDRDVQYSTFGSDDTYEEGDWDWNKRYCRVDDLGPDEDASDDAAEEEKAEELQRVLCKDGEGEDICSDASPGSGDWYDYSASEGGDEA